MRLRDQFLFKWKTEKAKILLETEFISEISEIKNRKWKLDENE